MGIWGWLFPPYTPEPDPAALQESFLPPVGGYSDPDSGLTAAQGGSAFYRSLSRNLGRDLSPVTQGRSLQIAYFLFESNPLAKTALELTKDFVIGEGVTVEAGGADEKEQESLQRVADRFWNDSVNKMDMKLHGKVMELGLWGEQCWPIFSNPADGHVRLGYIDPALIKTVITDPENVEVVIAVVLNSAGGGDDVRYRVAHVDEDPQGAWYGRMRGVTRDKRTGEVLDTWQDTDASGKPIGEPKPYRGACFYYAVNKVTTARRGRSDLLVNFDWIDIYDQILLGEADRADLLKLFVWDVTLEGMNEAEIDAYRAREGQPKPGTARYHNERVTWNAVTPDLKSADVSILADLLLSYISAGARLPKTWLAGTMDVNKATAGALEEPVFKRLAARQRYVKAMLAEVMTFVFDQAEMAGVLPKRPKRDGAMAPQPWPFRVVMPEMRGKDMTSAASAVAQIMQALTAALADKVIDVAVAQDVLAALLGQVGVEVDLDVLRKRLEAAAEETAAKAATAPYDNAAQGDGADMPGDDGMDAAAIAADAAARLAGVGRNGNGGGA